MRGVRFNFVTHLGGTPDLDAMQLILGKVKPLGWHLIIHVNAEDLVTFDEFFAKIDMPIVVDHMGRVPCDQGTGQQAFQILKSFMRRENWWCKICGAERISRAGPPFHDAIPFARADRSRRRIASCGAPTFRTPISRAGCRTTATCSTCFL